MHGGGLRGHTAFYKLWAAITLSSYGSHFGTMAIALVAALTFDASPFEIGVLGAAATLPGLIIGLPSGVWVDRFRRKDVLVLNDLARALLLLIAVGLLAGGWMNLWLLCVVVALVSCATVPYDVAMMAYLPSLVKGRASLTANSRLETSRSTANLAAPALAGSLFAVLQGPAILLFNGLSFAVSAVLIKLIRVEEPAPVRSTDGTWLQVKSGLAFVAGNPFLHRLGVCSALLNFFRIMFWSFMVVYQTKTLHMSAAEIGLVNGLGSIGMIAASLVATPLLHRFGVKRTLLGAVFLCTAPLLALCAVPPNPSLVSLIAIHTVHGFGWVLYHANQIGIRQIITPPDLRGRMNATMRFYEWGATPLASVAGGLLATVVGMRPALVIAAGLGVLTCLTLRSLRVPDLDGSETRMVPDANRRFGVRNAPSDISPLGAPSKEVCQPIPYYVSSLDDRNRKAK